MIGKLYKHKDDADAKFRVEQLIPTVENPHDGAVPSTPERRRGRSGATRRRTTSSSSSR
jgi:hypothetical protein